MDLIDAIKSLLSAGPPAGRPALPTLPEAAGGGGGGGGGAAWSPARLAAAHPCLRAPVWAALRAGLHTGAISARYARRAGAELALSLDCACALTRQRALAAPACFAALRAVLRDVLWAQAALLSDLTLGRAPGAGAAALEPPPAALGAASSPAAAAADPSSGTAAPLPTWPSSAASVVSEVTTTGGSGIPGQGGDISAGAAARMLSRLEDVVALLRAACRLLLLTPDEVRQALRGDHGKAAVDGGACPLLAVLAGALRATAAAARASPTAAKRIAAMLLQDAAPSQLVTGASAAAAVSPLLAEPLIALALRARAAAVAEAARAPASAPLLVEECGTVAGHVEALLVRCFFANDNIAGYAAAACAQGLLLPQAAALAYAQARRGGEGAAADRVHRLAPPAAAAQEGRLFSVLGPLLRQRARAGEAPLADSLPFFLATYAARLQEQVAAGELPSAAAPPQAPDASPPPAPTGVTAIAIKRPRRDDGGEPAASAAAATSAAAPDAIAAAALAAVAAAPLFAFFAELAAATIGLAAFAVPALGSAAGGSGAVARRPAIETSQAFFPFSAAAPVAGFSVGDGDGDAAVAEDARRVRGLAALLATAVQTGVYAVREDVAPHPQTATVWALARWVLHAAQQRAATSAAARRGGGGGITAATALAMAHAAAGAAVALLELSHEIAQPLLPALVAAISRLSRHAAACGTSADAASCGVALTSVVVKAVDVFSKLRQIDACFDFFAGVLRLPARGGGAVAAAAAAAPASGGGSRGGNDGDDAGAGGDALLHRLFLSRPVLAAVGLALRDMPQVQTHGVVSQLLRMLEHAVVAAASAAAPGAAAASSPAQSPAAAAGTVHVVSALSAEALRQLCPATHSVSRCLHLAAAFCEVATRDVLAIAQATQAGRSPSARGAALLLRLSAATLINAATDAALVCAPFAAVRRFVPSLLEQTAAAPASAPSLLDVRWPLCLFAAAAAAVAPLPLQAPAVARLAVSITAATSVVDLFRALDEGDGDGAAGTDDAALLDLCHHAALVLGETRLRLLHIMAEGRAAPDEESAAAAAAPPPRKRSKPLAPSGVVAAAPSRAVADAQHAAAVLADHLLAAVAGRTAPALQAVALGAVDVACASASAGALATFAHALWSSASAAESAVPGDGRQVARLLAAGAARQLLCEVQLYELQPLRAPLASAAATAVVQACGRTLAGVLPPGAAKALRAACLAAQQLAEAAGPGMPASPTLITAAAAAAVAAAASAATAASLPAAISSEGAAAAAAATEACTRILDLVGVLPDAAALLVDESAASPMLLSLIVLLLALLCGAAPSEAPAARARLAALENAVLRAVGLLWRPAELLTSHLSAPLAHAAELAIARRAAADAGYLPPPALLRVVRLGLSAAGAAAEAPPASLPLTSGAGALIAASRVDALRASLVTRPLAPAQLELATALAQRAQAGLAATDSAVAPLAQLAGSLLHLSVAAASKPLLRAAIGLHARACRTLLLRGSSGHGDEAVDAFVASTAAALALAHVPSSAAAAASAAGAFTLDFVRVYASSSAAAAARGSVGSEPSAAAASPGGAADAVLRLLPVTASAMAELRSALAAALAPARAGGGAGDLFDADGALLLLQRLLATTSACVAERVMRAAAAAGGGDRAEDAAAPPADRAAALASLYAALCPWEAPAAAAAAAATAARQPSAAAVAHVGDGGSAATDAVTALFRALMPAILACVARGGGGSVGGSDSHTRALPLRARALLCLREFVASPRVFALRSDEAALILEAVAASMSQAVAAAAHVTAASAARVPATGEPLHAVSELADIDVGRPAALSTPIVVKAARFCAGLLEQPSAAAAATAATATDARDTDTDTAELQASLWLLHSLVKYRRDAAVSAMPLISHALQSAMARLPALLLRQAPAHSPSRQADPRQAAAALARLCEVYAEAIRPMRYHAVNVLAAGLCALAQAERSALAARGAGAGALAAATAAITPPVYALFAACTRKELQQLHAALAPRPAARALLKALHRGFDEGARYRGS